MGLICHLICNFLGLLVGVYAATSGGREGSRKAVEPSIQHVEQVTGVWRSSEIVL